jgi:hypothetical protein
MRHRMIHWRMARADVDDAELAALLLLERRTEGTSSSSIPISVIWARLTQGG